MKASNSPPESSLSNSSSISFRSSGLKVPLKSKTLGERISPPRSMVPTATLSPAAIRKGRILSGKSSRANSIKSLGALPTSRLLGSRGDRCSASIVVTTAAPSPCQSRSPFSPITTVSRARLIDGINTPKIKPTASTYLALIVFLHATQMPYCFSVAMSNKRYNWMRCQLKPLND